jgi:acyl-[acyl-carrier-protein] desaturase
MESGTTNPQFENRLYQLYLEFFNRAEAERRWNIQKDIPWDKANPQTTDAIALIVESFCAVELFLPDYTSKILHLIRKSRGRAWFQANWGYEESKHSLALEEWLIRSGKRTQKEIREFSDVVLQREWDMPFQTPRQMMVYTTFQELSTGLNYRNLRRKAIEQKDDALAVALSYIARDESAHYQFFQDGVKLYMQEDRDGTLNDIRYVLEHFRMPAQDLIPNWEVRGQTIIGENVFSDRIFFKDIMRPILSVLGTSRNELKELSTVAPELKETTPLAR